jgi:hypothetical protein
MNGTPSSTARHDIGLFAWSACGGEPRARQAGTPIVEMAEVKARTLALLSRA